MKKKILLYAAVPMLALAAFGASSASAHSFLSFMNNATPQEIAQKQKAMFNEQATMLGVSVDEIKNAWTQGKTLQELAVEKGISQEQLKQKMNDTRTQQMTTHLQVLVSQGEITQAQADQRLQILKQQMQNANGKKGKGLGRGFGGMGL